LNKLLLTSSVFVLVLAINLTLATSVFAATMSLSPATLSRRVNETFTVDVVVDPEGTPTSGATAIIDYDTSKLRAVTVVAGADYSEELENSIDPTSGQIRYEAGVLGETVSSRTTLAKITFTPIAAGTAEVKIVYDPNATVDTSIVAAAENPTNLLAEGKVNNGIYTITSATASGGTGGGGTVGSLPGTGAVENTIALVGFGIVVFAFGTFLGRKALFVI
jgi:hypothetical protein